jgi:hypothetical protein
VCRGDNSKLPIAAGSDRRVAVRKMDVKKMKQQVKREGCLQTETSHRNRARGSHVPVVQRNPLSRDFADT